jgi:lysylphosphatidylglycerol synthetase-like protein (DUF2156 family)
MRSTLHHPNPDFPTSTVSDRPLVKPQPPNRRRSIWLTLACDITLFLVALGVGLAINAPLAKNWPASASVLEHTTIKQMPFWTMTSISGWFLLKDVWCCYRPHGWLPFDKTAPTAQHLYWQRFEFMWYAIASCLVLICLCLLMPAYSLVSKIFFASVITLVALAVRQSIPIPTRAFAASTGVFAVTMLIISIAGAFSR